jgi:undecaprenyl phosphate-alpha-L-ara4N flippase subunit ArnE
VNATIVFLVLIPLAISAGQILFKIASRSVGSPDLTGIAELAFNPWLLSALALYGTATVAWIFVIRDVPIAKAYLFMSLTFVAVPIIAYLTLGEPVSLRHALGTAIIIAGIVVATT